MFKWNTISSNTRYLYTSGSKGSLWLVPVAESKQKKWLWSVILKASYQYMSDKQIQGYAPTLYEASIAGLTRLLSCRKKSLFKLIEELKLDQIFHILSS